MKKLTQASHKISLQVVKRKLGPDTKSIVGKWNVKPLKVVKSL